MAKYDLESILDDVKTTITSNIGAKITAINSEKSDDAVLVSISNDAYFLQSLDEEVVNKDPFVVYGIEDIESVYQHGNSSEILSIYVAIVISDNGRKDINRVLFRYQRILKEIFEENFQNNNFSNKISVTRLTPVAFDAFDSSAQFKAIGIILETTLPS